MIVVFWRYYKQCSSWVSKFQRSGKWFNAHDCLQMPESLPMLSQQQAYILLTTKLAHKGYKTCAIASRYRDYSVHAPSRWDTTLHCNIWWQSSDLQLLCSTFCGRVQHVYIRLMQVCKMETKIIQDWESTPICNLCETAIPLFVVMIWYCKKLQMYTLDHRRKCGICHVSWEELNVHYVIRVYQDIFHGM